MRVKNKLRKTLNALHHDWLTLCAVLAVSVVVGSAISIMFRGLPDQLSLLEKESLRGVLSGLVISLIVFFGVSSNPKHTSPSKIRLMTDSVYRYRGIATIFFVLPITMFDYVADLYFFFNSDITDVLHPSLYIFYEWLSRGLVAWWNPYVGSGHEMTPWGHFPINHMTPFFLVFGYNSFSFNLSIALNISLAVVGYYLVFRRIGKGAQMPSAILALSIIPMPVVGQFIFHVVHIGTIVFIPFILVALDFYFNKRCGPEKTDIRLLIGVWTFIFWMFVFANAASKVDLWIYNFGIFFLGSVLLPISVLFQSKKLTFRSWLKQAGESTGGMIVIMLLFLSVYAVPLELLMGAVRGSGRLPSSLISGDGEIDIWLVKNFISTFVSSPFLWSLLIVWVLMVSWPRLSTNTRVSQYASLVVIFCVFIGTIVIVLSNSVFLDLTPLDCYLLALISLVSLVMLSREPYATRLKHVLSEPFSAGVHLIYFSWVLLWFFLPEISHEAGGRHSSFALRMPYAQLFMTLMFLTAALPAKNSEAMFFKLLFMALVSLRYLINFILIHGIGVVWQPWRDNHFLFMCVFAVAVAVFSTTQQSVSQGNSDLSQRVNGVS